MNGIVMTGGGARGAYQAGVLKRIGEIPLLRAAPSPFKVISGASAGAVNSVFLASGAESFGSCSEQLAKLWSELEAGQVFRTDLVSLGPRAGRWLKDLSLGGVLGGGHAQSLLDFSPLHTLLSEKIKFPAIERNIKLQNIYGLAIAATNYTTGKAYIFVQGAAGHPLWKRSRRIAVSTDITPEHVCASAAIPVVFQPILITTEYGSAYFGDGCLRLTTPLSPAIRLGADRILAIGVRARTTDAESINQEQAQGDAGSHHPPIAQVLGVVLNAIFLDHLDADIEHLKRLNELVESSGEEVLAAMQAQHSVKTVQPLSITPSQDIGAMAETHAHQLPKMVRYLMKGLSDSGKASSDLLSYLLFDSSFTSALVDLGYKDASARIDEIEQFLLGSPDSSARSSVG